jgi:N-methylhydantoinase B/oxoprolinase/acetone carboxylase alpha subunit
VPNEFLEAYFPLRIDSCQTVPDSGGPGFFRGGNGIDVYRFLSIDELRERCLAETGLPAPKPPVFRRMAAPA